MRLMKPVLFVILLALSVVVPAQAAEVRLALTGVGRFAVFADISSIQPDGDGVRMRAFQVVEDSFAVDGTGYWGGWSWWRFDCAAHTADRLDFAAVRTGGEAGPAVADAAGPYEASPGGDAAELLAMACRPETAATAVEVGSLAEAVSLGRERLAD